MLLGRSEKIREADLKKKLSKIEKIASHFNEHILLLYANRDLN